MTAVIAAASNGIIPIVLTVAVSLMAFTSEFQTQQDYDDFFMLQAENAMYADSNRQWDVWDGDKLLYPNLSWEDAWEKVRDIRDNWKDTDYIDDLQVKYHEGNVAPQKDESMNWLKRWRNADAFANRLRRDGVEEDEVQRLKREKYRDLYNEDGTPRTHNEWWLDKHPEYKQGEEKENES